MNINNIKTYDEILKDTQDVIEKQNKKPKIKYSDIFPTPEKPKNKPKSKKYKKIRKLIDLVKNEKDEAKKQQYLIILKKLLVKSSGLKQ